MPHNDTYIDSLTCEMITKYDCTRPVDLRNIARAMMPWEALSHVCYFSGVSVRPPNRNYHSFLKALRQAKCDPEEEVVKRQQLDRGASIYVLYFIIVFLGNRVRTCTFMGLEPASWCLLLFLSTRPRTTMVPLLITSLRSPSGSKGQSLQFLRLSCLSSGSKLST